jgi:hypothetical protein
MTVDWSAAMAEVEHHVVCGSYPDADGRVFHPCTCDRDALIGRKIAAVREADARNSAMNRDYEFMPRSERDAAALAAFRGTT